MCALCGRLPPTLLDGHAGTVYATGSTLSVDPVPWCCGAAYIDSDGWLIISQSDNRSMCRVLLSVDVPKQLAS